MTNPIEGTYFTTFATCDTCESLTSFTTGEVHGYVGNGIIALKFDIDSGPIQLRALKEILDWEFYESRAQLHKENNSLAKAIGHHINQKCPSNEAGK